GGDYSYCTFAGAAMNRVLAAWAGAGRFAAGNIVLRCDEPIDFSQLPTDPEELSHLAAGQALRTPEALTLFQMALPPHLLARELADLWRQTPVFARSLMRLRHARLVQAPWEVLAELGY
ncbi:MAG TPA: hypothetical protein VIU62_15660, partial [Chloroflexota bacterium]